jgi:hypothetical protein
MPPLTPEEENQVKADINRVLSERLEHFIGELMTDAVLANVRAHFEDVLKMVSLSWNAPVAEDIEITIENDVADRSKLNISMKPKPGLDSYRYCRVQRFLLGEDAVSTYLKKE